jgi:hypothetical protein
MASSDRDKAIQPALRMNWIVSLVIGRALRGPVRNMALLT